jgi:D-tyrosyl-tRNA(Tyr) deacylase
VRGLLQRVSAASVSIDGETVGRIGRGLVALIGVAADDTERDVSYLVSKTVNLRIFPDAADKFNLSLLDIRGELLVISQFTLLAETRHGRRPSFSSAAAPEKASALYDEFITQARAIGVTVAMGRFQAYMQVEIHNDGPVTVMLDSLEARRIPELGAPRRLIA